MSGLFRDAIGRREFIGTGLAMLTTTTLPVLQSVRASDSPVAANLLADWTIDDMWGVYPRYAEAIGFGRPRPAAAPVVACVDRDFVP